MTSPTKLTVAASRPVPAGHPEPIAPPPPRPPSRFDGLIALASSAGPYATAVWNRKWIALAVLAVLVLAINFGPTALLGPKVAGEAAVRGLFVQSVVASGHVEAPYRVNIASQITAVVANVPVVEGQMVKAGQTLIELDDRELRAVVTQAEGVVAQAEARLRQLREVTHPAAEQSLKQAEATLTNAQNNFDRTSKLNRDGYATRVALDEATRALDVAKAQVKSAEYQVLTTQAGGSDYAMASTQLSQAKAALASAQSRFSYTVIKAPRDGGADFAQRGSLATPLRRARY